MVATQRIRESETTDDAVPQVRVAAGRMRTMIGFLAIFAVALSGYAGVGLWVIGASAIALAAISYAEHEALYRRGNELGLGRLVDGVLLRSLGNGFAAATIAYFGGFIVRLM